MIRYIAFLCDEQAVAKTSDCVQRARKHDSGLKIVLQAPGLVVLTSSGATDPKPQLLGRDQGILLGTLFTAPGLDTDGTDCRRAYLSNADAQRIVSTDGRVLIDQYWGNYIAFLRPRGHALVRVIRAPFARLSCLHSAVDGMRMYASDMEIIAHLRIRLHSISWQALARTFLGPEAPGPCHLNEIREIPGGACEDASGTEYQRQLLWDPVSISSVRFQSVDGGAAGALRSTTRACIHAWAREHSHVLVGLSGGLDSSVTLSCAAAAPPASQVTAVTQFGEDRESDERIYARLMTRHAGCKLIEVPRTSKADLCHCEYSALFECSPGLHLPSVDRIEPEIAHRIGADVIFRGDGGDELFCRNQTSLYLMDFLHERGWSAGFVDLLTHAAHTEGTTVWNILLRALWHSVRPSKQRREMLAPEVLEGSLLSQDVLTELNTQSCIRDDDGSLPPGRRWQIHLLNARRNLSGPFDLPRDPEVICPLLSQPLVELCLRIPTWLQMTDHSDRALTRRAFSDDLPSEILCRTDKGGAEQMATEILYDNLPYLRERLLDGLVVQSGIIDRRRLEASLGLAPSADAVNSAPLFELLGAENWARAWRRFNIDQSSTFNDSPIDRSSSAPSLLA